jgi:hypothetical protein
MFHALVVLAAEAGKDEPSKTPFYIVGGLWAGWAIVLFLVGSRVPDFPSSQGAARGVMAISGVLMVAAMAAAVLTS